MAVSQTVELGAGSEQVSAKVEVGHKETYTGAAFVCVCVCEHAAPIVVFTCHPARWPVPGQDASSLRAAMCLCVVLCAEWPVLMDGDGGREVHALHVALERAGYYPSGVWPPQLGWVR